MGEMSGKNSSFSEYPLTGRRIFVTGGSRGLGRAFCLAFARAGGRIAFSYSKDDRDAEETRQLIQSVKNEIHGDGADEVLVYKFSVAEGKAVQANVKSIMEAWGGIDVLVNNAAINQMMPMALLEEDDWDLVMDVNLKGVYLMTRAVLRHMIRAKSGQILNLGSFASERFVESPVHYAASKSALRGFTEALAQEVGRHNIQVNLFSPGLLESGMSNMVPAHRLKEYLEQCALGRTGSLEEIAATAVFLVSGENSFMTGAKLVLDGGL